MGADRFHEIEKEFLRLKGQLATGRITSDQFRDALPQLMVQDAQGHYWTLHPESGAWLVSDGQSWAPANPPSIMPSVPPLPKHPMAPPVSQRSGLGRSCSLPILLLGGMFLCALLLIGAALILVFPPSQIAQGTRSAPSTSGPATTSIPTSSTGTPAQGLATYQAKSLTLDEFISFSDSLPAAVADLNRAELQFLADAKTTLALETNGHGIGLMRPFFADIGTDKLDLELRTIAARAYKVALLSEPLARTVVSQDNGSDLTVKLAGHYVAVTRLAYALAIESHNLRDDLTKGSLKRSAAVNTVTEYGARLWNPKVTGLEGNIPPSANATNPFSKDLTNAAALVPVRFLTPDLAKQFQGEWANATPHLWVTMSTETFTKTVSVPAPRSLLADPFDPALLSKFTDPAEQVDGDRARQVAEWQIGLGASEGSGTRHLQAGTKTVIVTDIELLKALVVPMVRGGTAALVSQQSMPASIASLNTALPQQALSANRGVSMSIDGYSDGGDKGPVREGRITVEGPGIVGVVRRSPALKIQDLKVFPADPSRNVGPRLAYRVVADAPDLTNPGLAVSCSIDGARKGGYEIRRVKGTFGEYAMDAEFDGSSSGRSVRIHCTIGYADDQGIYAMYVFVNQTATLPAAPESGKKQGEILKIKGTFQTFASDGLCRIPVPMTGSIDIEVDMVSGMATGTFQGTGSGTWEWCSRGRTVPGIVYGWTREWNGDLFGAIELTTPSGGPRGLTMKGFPKAKTNFWLVSCPAGTKCSDPWSSDAKGGEVSVDAEIDPLLRTVDREFISVGCQSGCLYGESGGGEWEIIK